MYTGPVTTVPQCVGGTCVCDLSGIRICPCLKQEHAACIHRVGNYLAWILPVSVCVHVCVFCIVQVLSIWFVYVHVITMVDVCTCNYYG